jgi:hypothetical protein
MANGRRCSIGCESWPDEALYAKCPRCGEKTTRFNNLEPLTSAEAKAIRMELQAENAADVQRQRFEKFYADRCEKLGIPADGPLPSYYEQALPAPRSLVG